MKRRAQESPPREMPPANPQKTQRVFVRGEHRVNYILAGAILLIAAVLVAILVLLQNRPLRDSGRAGAGLGRDFLFPFVFTSEDGSLRVIRDEQLAICEIDDSVSQCVHDTKRNRVYYLRENVLYEYDMDANRRRELTGDVASYALSEDRSAIFCVGTDASLKLYDGTQSRLLSEREEGRTEGFYAMGANTVLFLEEYDAQNGTGVLCSADMRGNVRHLGIRVNARRRFAPSAGGSRICYYVEDTFCIADSDGKLLDSFSGGMPVETTRQTSLLQATTRTVQYNTEIPTRYIVTELEGSAGDEIPHLVYFTGSKTSEIAENIGQIIYYSADSDLILYTTHMADGNVRVCKSSGGSAQEAQIVCPAETKFLFDNDMNYLYYQLPDGVLCRYNIYDVNLRSVTVSEHTGMLYQYLNKPFVAYTGPDSDNVYLIHSDNQIQQYNLRKERRLYGQDDYAYLLMRTYGADRISLDFVDRSGYTRIGSNVGEQVFFDKRIEYVLYCADGKLRCWHAEKSTEVGDFTEVSAVAVVN